MRVDYTASRRVARESEVMSRAAMSSGVVGQWKARAVWWVTASARFGLDVEMNNGVEVTVGAEMSGVVVGVSERFCGFMLLPPACWPSARREETWTRTVTGEAELA